MQRQKKLLRLEITIHGIYYLIQDDELKVKTAPVQIQVPIKQVSYIYFLITHIVKFIT